MSEINNSGSGQWSETDASNTSASPNGWPAGTFFNQVEPIGRSTMGAIKRFWNRINGTITSTGASGHYVYTPANTGFPTAYVQGETYTFKADKDSAGSDDLNINSLGAKNLYKITSAGITAIAAADIKIGAHVMVQYDAAYNSSAGGFFILAGISPTNTSYKVVNFSRNVATSSGTSSITGVGFQPKAAIFFSGFSGGGNIASASWGLDDGTSHFSWFNFAGSFVNNAAGGQSINFTIDNSNKTVGIVQSFDSDGLTIFWTKTGSPTGTGLVYALLFK